VSALDGDEPAFTNSFNGLQTAAIHNDSGLEAWGVYGHSYSYNNHLETRAYGNCNPHDQNPNTEYPTDPT
jgi:hypothetical protein